LWKRLLLLITLWLLLSLPTSADGPIYFPLINPLPPCGVEANMSDWKVIVPVATTNMVLNPSAETTGNFAATAGATVTRVTTYQHYGLDSYRVETNANNEGIELTLSALTNAIHYVTVRVRGTLPTTWDWSLNGSTFHQPTLLETIDGDWKLYGVQIPAAQASGSALLEIHQNGSGSGDFYLDGVQVEAHEDYTTYCDGTQEGCAWNGAVNGSTSSRSAESKAGGYVYDLEDDYGFYVTGMSGTGTAPQELFTDAYAQLPGGELNTRKVNSRVFTLTGLISEPTEAEFYATKQALETLFDPDAYPERQPTRIRFTGATVHKEISAFYETGLETNITADDPCAWERVAVRFLADDPYWYEIGESAAALDTNDSATLRVVTGRLRSTGQWDDLGPPNAGGTYNTIRAMAEDNTYIYYGGTFQNFDNIANADYIVRYNKQTGAYSAMGTGGDNTVFALAIGPDGRLYAGGAFNSMGGVADTVRIAVWDGSAWAALGTGMGGTVYALAFDAGGDLIAGGNFTTAGGGAANRIAEWDGSAWAALGTGMDSDINAVAVKPDGNIIATGAFSTADGSPALRIAEWDGSAWSALGSGLDGVGEALAVSPDGIVYVGGGFITADGVTVAFVAAWNGTTFKPLGDGVNGSVYSLSLGADGMLYAGGAFTQAGGVDLGDRVARWNGSSWGHLDIDLPGSPTAYVYASKYTDPVVSQKYNLYLGFSTSGTGSYAGIATVTSAGTTPAFPRIYFNRSGGTTAVIQTLRNERTGQELLFNYSLLDGETLTVDLSSPEKSITSSFFGARQDAVLANSDLGEWGLLKGSNDITSFVSTSGSPTVTAFMLWKDRYRSQN
jgi:hypothetical protein